MNAGVKAELHDRRKPLEERDYSRWTGIAGVTIPASRASSLLCPLRGVRPCCRTGSGGSFDRGPGVLILEPIRADVAQGGM